MTMEEWRKKGLCYNCDEKFSPSHHCTQQRLYLLDANAFIDEEYESEIKEGTKEPKNHNEETHVISYSALAGFSSS